MEANRSVGNVQPSPPAPAADSANSPGAVPYSNMQYINTGFSAQPAAYTYPVPGQPSYPYSFQQPPFQGVAYVPSNMNQMMVVRKQPTKEPVQMMCPHCKYPIITTIKYINGRLTFLVCGILGAFLIWPFCLIPLCMKKCKDVEHSCPACQAVIHVQKRL